MSNRSLFFYFKGYISGVIDNLEKSQFKKLDLFRNEMENKMYVIDMFISDSQNFINGLSTNEQGVEFANCAREDLEEFMHSLNTIKETLADYEAIWDNAYKNSGSPSDELVTADEKFKADMRLNYEVIENMLTDTLAQINTMIDFSNRK